MGTLPKSRDSYFGENRVSWDGGLKLGRAHLFAAGVVVDDAPAFGKLAKEQGKQPVRLLAVREGEVPPATNKCTVLSEHLNLDVGHLQFAHLGIGGLILFAIALQGRLPALGFGGAGKENQLPRIPVSGHETFEIDRK